MSRSSQEPQQHVHVLYHRVRHRLGGGLLHSSFQGLGQYRPDRSFFLKEPYRAAPRHGYHLPHHLGRSRLALDEDFRVIHLQNNSQRRCKAAAFESQRLFLLAKVILRVFEFPLIFLNQKATFVLLTELHFGQLGKRLHWAQR